MLIKKQWPLLAAAGADGGDGAGGGAGGGAGAGGGDGGGTDDIPESTKKFVSQAVNQALSGWSKRLEGKTADLIKNSIAESLKGFQPAQRDDAGAGGGGGGGASDHGGAPPKDDPHAREIAKLRGETESLQKKLAAEERARAEEREAQARREEKEALVAELRKYGVPDARIKGAVAYLTFEAKVIQRAEDGSITWPLKKAYGMEPAPLAEGLAEWLKTDEGKSYLPPAEAGGSGQRGAPKGPAKPGDKYDPASAKRELGNAILGALGGGGGIFGGGGGG